MQDDTKQEGPEPPTMVWVLPGIVGGLVGALVGAGLWAAVGILSDYVTSLLAILVGLIVGGGVLLGSGRRRGLPFQIIGGTMALLSIVIGKYLMFYHMDTQRAIEIYGQAVFDSSGVNVVTPEIVRFYIDNFGVFYQGMDLLFIGLAVFMGFMFPGKKGRTDAEEVGAEETDEDEAVDYPSEVAVE